MIDALKSKLLGIGLRITGGEVVAALKTLDPLPLAAGPTAEREHVLGTLAQAVKALPPSERPAPARWLHILEAEVHRLVALR